MDFPEKRLLVVGDRVLITPEDGDDRTRVGLYLPPTALDAQQVQTGLIVATGPGDPVPDVSTLDDEPWKVASSREPRTRGMQARIGDHAMFFRRADFLAVGGCDPKLLVMEEADLCIRFHRLGRTRLVNRVVITSDRRVAAWGALRANWIYFRVGARWGLGFRKGLERHYPHVR